MFIHYVQGKAKLVISLGLDNYFLSRNECIWFNKHIRSKSKQYFYYETWYTKGISVFSDLLYMYLPTPVIKSFGDLIIEHDISYRDRRKYNSLLDSIVDSEILADVNTVDFKGGFDPFSVFFLIKIIK